MKSSTATGFPPETGDAHDLRAGRRVAIPRAVVGDQKVAAIVVGKCRRLCEETHAERRGVSLECKCRCDGFRAARCIVVLRIRDAIPIAVWPAVVSTIADDVDLLGRQILMIGRKIVALVLRRPECSGLRIHCESYGVPEAHRIHSLARSVLVEPEHRGALRRLLSTHRLQDEPIATYIALSAPKTIVRDQCPPPPGK